MDLLQQVKEKIEKLLPGSEVSVQDTSAGHEDHNPGAHVGVYVQATQFKDKTLVEQHQMINSILQEDLKKDIHALSIKTEVKQ